MLFEKWSSHTLTLSKIWGQLAAESCSLMTTTMSLYPPVFLLNFIFVLLKPLTLTKWTTESVNSKDVTSLAIILISLLLTSHFPIKNPLNEIRIDIVGVWVSVLCSIVLFLVRVQRVCICWACSDSRCVLSHVWATTEEGGGRGRSTVPLSTL